MVNRHVEESSQKSNEFKEWMNKVKEDTNRNLQNQDAAIRNLETQIGQLVKDFEAKKIEPEVKICKVVFAQEEQENDRPSSSLTSEVCRINYLKKDESKLHEEVLPCQLPIKEPDPGDFLLPCTTGNFKILAAADLGASVNLMSYSLFEILHLTNLKETTMILEMVDTTKSRPRGTIDNVLVKVSKFLFPADFVIIDIDQCQGNNLILGRPFLVISHTHIKVLEKQIYVEAGGTYKFQLKRTSYPNC